MAHAWNIGSGWESLLFSPLFTAVLFAFWAILVVALIGSLGETSEQAGAHIRPARKLLEEHLARGEIDREDYVDHRKALDHITAII
jgi:uncharacterized membrane protein